MTNPVAATNSPDWMTAQVVHSNAGLWWRDGYQWRGIGHTGTVSPLSALPEPFNVGVTTQPGPITVVIDADGNVACDLDSITSLDGDIRELLSDYLPGDTTQPQPTDETLEALKRERGQWQGLIDDWADAYGQLKAAVAEVRALHRGQESVYSGKLRCLGCGFPYPCPTIAALDKAGAP